VHFREILSGYFLFSRFDWSIFVTQLVAKHMKEIIKIRFLEKKILVAARSLCKGLNRETENKKTQRQKTLKKLQNKIYWCLIFVKRKMIKNESIHLRTGLLNEV
jgi:hypothetical protein